MINQIKNTLKRVDFIYKMYNLILKILKKIDDILLYLATVNNLFLRLKVFFDKQYQFEYKVLLNGIKEYRRNLKLRRNEYYLRRQLHRLEKGLIHKNKKKVFALEFILPTVEVFEKLYSVGETYEDFLVYAYSVLSQYFSITESKDERYLQAKKLFESLSLNFKKKNVEKFYVSTYYNPRKNISFDEFKNLVVSRKSIRHFSSKEVSNEIFEKAIEIARYAPSGCNRQPYRFLVIKDKEILNVVKKLPPGGGGNAFDAPAVVFVIGDQSAFSTTSSSHECYIDASLASMIFVLALECLGVSSCFMNWPHIYQLDQQARKLLNLKPYEVIVTTIAVGYAEEGAICAISKRKEVKQLLEIL